MGRIESRVKHKEKRVKLAKIRAETKWTIEINSEYLGEREIDRCVRKS